MSQTAASAARSGGPRSPKVQLTDRPDPSWTPIQAAPFRYHASWRPIGRSDPRREIDQLAAVAVVGPDIVRCTIDWDKNCVTIGCLVASPDGDETEIVQFSPYSVRGRLSPDHTTPDEWEKFINDIEELWRKMEAQFRHALQAGKCRLFARCGEPTAEHFREISPDDFRFFRVIDWDRGVAEDNLGNRLYSLHAAPPRSDEDEISQKAIDAATVSDTPTVSLEPETERPNSGVQKDTRVQSGASPTSNNASIDDAGDDGFLTIEQAMVQLQIGRSTLYTLLKENDIKRIKVRRRTFIGKNDMKKFISEKTVG